jgi:hypothetical protein
MESTCELRRGSNSKKNSRRPLPRRSRESQAAALSGSALRASAFTTGGASARCSHRSACASHFQLSSGCKNACWRQSSAIERHCCALSIIPSRLVDHLAGTWCSFRARSLQKSYGRQFVGSRAMDGGSRRNTQSFCSSPGRLKWPAENLRRLQRADFIKKKWSEREDLNLRPLVSQSNG